MRVALRRLRSSPVFTIAATLTMAIAIGATASVFGLVDGVLLKAFPYRDPSEMARDGSHIAQVFGRLAPGVTPEAARRELNVVAGRLAMAYPETSKGWSIFALSLPDQLVGDVRPALVMLLAAAACVLLIGAANLANLFLVRNLTRERELAVRTALGATRGRLVRELLAEALLLGGGAAAIGVGLAAAGVAAFRTLAPAVLPRVGDIAVDARVVAFCAVTTLLTVVIFGVLPA